MVHRYQAQRRRQKLLVVKKIQLSLMAGMLYMTTLNIANVQVAKKSLDRMKSVIIEREKEGFTSLTSHMTSEVFKGNFRMTRCMFYNLVRICRPHISRFSEAESSRELQCHLSGNCVQAEIRIAIFLRMMAGGSVHDIANTFRVSESTCYKTFDIMLDVILTLLPFQDLPETEEELIAKAAEFSESRPVSNPLLGCIGSIDGIAIAIEKPPEGYNPLHFYNRKGYFALPVQAVVDADYRFIAVSITCSGSTHDALCYKLSNIYENLEKGNVPKGFWIAGDDAYPTSPYLITPFSSSFASSFQDSFNFFHSSMRVHVEQSFGMLKRRWGILWRPLRYHLHRSIRIIPAAMKLQNYCINNGLPIRKRKRSELEWAHAFDLQREWLRWVRTNQENMGWSDVDIEQMSTLSRQAENKFTVRKKLVNLVRFSGLLRPKGFPRDNLPPPPLRAQEYVGEGLFASPIPSPRSGGHR